MAIACVSSRCVLLPLRSWVLYTRCHGVAASDESHRQRNRTGLFPAGCRSISSRVPRDVGRGCFKGAVKVRCFSDACNRRCRGDSICSILWTDMERGRGICSITQHLGNILVYLFTAQHDHQRPREISSRFQFKYIDIFDQIHLSLYWGNFGECSPCNRAIFNIWDLCLRICLFYLFKICWRISAEGGVYYHKEFRTCATLHNSDNGGSDLRIPVNSNSNIEFTGVCRIWDLNPTERPSTEQYYMYF